jgi:hypothetical protein
MLALFMVLQHIPPKTARGVIRNRKKIKIRTRHNGDGTKCTIKTYKRDRNGPTEMYLTEGWYDFKRSNNLKIGDKLEFQLSDPPHVLVVDIVRKR